MINHEELVEEEKTEVFSSSFTLYHSSPTARPLSFLDSLGVWRKVEEPERREEEGKDKNEK